jgi:hypothetical protein
MVSWKSLTVFALGSFCACLCLADTTHNPISGLWVPAQPPTANRRVKARLF